MSTPTTSRAPVAPEQSSLMRPDGQFRRWLTYITDFIRATTPSSADVYDTGLVSDVFTANTNWEFTSQTSSRVGRTAHFELVGKYVGTAPITVPANGDIANQTIGTANTAWKPRVGAPAASIGTGTMVHGGMSTARNIYIAAVPPGTTITTGWTFSLAGSYLVD